MIGIYALWFEEPSMVYIGQSQNIDRRFNEHLLSLKANKATNYKLQNCYNLYGEPELVVLEECSIEQLNDLEIAWQKEFNSLTDGLDLIEAGQVGWGTNSNNSKYSKIQILQVFSLLYKTDLSYEEIANKTKTNKNLVIDIIRGHSHLWLKEVYSKQYEKMLKNKRPHISEINKAKGVGYNTTFISPEGVEYICCNVRALARELFPEESEIFRKGLSRIRTGSRKSYRGWTVKNRIVTATNSLTNG